MRMSQEAQEERRCKYDPMRYGVCSHEGDDPSTEECFDCIIESLAISIEDNKNIEAMHRLHILINIVKDL